MLDPWISKNLAVEREDRLPFAQSSMKPGHQLREDEEGAGEKIWELQAESKA